jgi:phycoerythrin-associated linker protein
VEYSAVERFTECVTCLGGALIGVNSIKKIWIGHHRQVILYQAKASLHTPGHELKQYWIKYGGFYTKFDDRCSRENFRND